MTSNAAAPRLAASLPVALLITAAMGAGMQALISADIPEFTRTVIVDPFVPPPPVLDRTPPKPEPTPPIETDLTAIGRVIELPPVAPPTDTVDTSWTIFRATLPTPGAQSSSFVAQGPQLLFPPFVDYPQSMYPREGSCDVSYDITAAGATTNVQVVSCTDRGFSRFAARVVEKAAYRPAQGETGPVASPGHVMSVDFRIEE